MFGIRTGLEELGFGGLEFDMTAIVLDALKGVLPLVAVGLLFGGVLVNKGILKMKVAWPLAMAILIIFAIL